MYEDGIFLETQMLGEVLDVFGPVEQSASGVWRAPSDSWSVDGDYAEVELGGYVVERSCFDAGAGEAMLVEDGFACWGAVLCVADFAAIREGESG